MCVQIENGALQIIPDSNAFAISPTGDQLTEDEAAVHAPPERRRFVLLKRGEVIVLHNWCLHRSEFNATDTARRGFSVCYIDVATALRPGEMGDEARAAAIESALHAMDADPSSFVRTANSAEQIGEARQRAEDIGGDESEDARRSKLWPQIFPTFFPAASMTGPRHATDSKL